MIKCRKFGVLILSLIILSVFAAVNVTALSEENDSIEDVPDLPLILQGEMDVNGEPVSAGSEITAYYEGEIIARSTVEEEGEYSLNLNLASEDYANIENVELYINGNEASFELPASQVETIESTSSGSILEVDINSSVSSDDETDSGGNSDSTGEAKIVEKNTTESETGANSEASLTGEDSTADGEDPVSQADGEDGESPDDAATEDTGDTESTADAGYSTVFTVLLFVVAVFSALLVIKR